MKRQFLSIAGTAGVFALPFCLNSCDGKDPGLVEKIALKEAELRERDSRLETLQQEMSHASKARATQETTAPDVEAAKSSYSGFIDELREKVAKELAGAKIERTAVFPIQGPDPAKPIVSQVVFRVVGINGQAGEIEFPLYADSSGQWQEPAIGDLATFKAGLDADPQMTENGTGTSAPTRQNNPKDVMGADSTVEIRWDDSSPAAKGRQGRPQPAAPQPAAPELPKKVMPTSRDVIIDFE